MYRVSIKPVLNSEPPQDARGPRPERDTVPLAALRTDEHLVTLRSPNSFEADQYRVLRHFLGGTGADRRQVVAVTSPAAGEGKTTTAVNLAATLAQSHGARVLLIDTDLRRPCVASRLGQSAGPGLAGAIVDEDLDLAAVVRPTPFKLSVLPAGAHPTNAYELLESPRFGRLLEEARGSYDHVILDTPPLLLVPDGRLLAQWVDGFVIVVAAHRTPRKLLAETLDAVDPAKLAGIVFNGDHRPLSGYYKKYYGSYYGDRARQEGGHRWLSWWRRRKSGRKSWR
jgi:capsular exopolysaccharide synthesis family protein